MLPRTIHKIYTVLFFLAVIPMPGLSQECDTILTTKDTANILYFYNSIDSLARGKLHPVRVDMDRLQYYNPMHEQHRFYAGLGNTGLPYQNLIFHPGGQDYFDFGLDNMQAYRYRKRSTKYYHLLDPFTEIFYIIGAKKEQLLRVKFDRKIAPNAGIGVNVRFLHAPGFYERQKADDKSMTAKAQFYTHDRRYGILGNYAHNKIFVQENGGIQNDSLFENNLETDRKLFLVNLESAENQIKENSFFINQYVNLSPPAGKDNKRSALGRITHSYHQIRQTRKYIDDDPGSGFYRNIYRDSTQTLDSVDFFRIENQLLWSNLGYNDSMVQKSFYVYAGVKNTYTKLGGSTPGGIFRQWTPRAGFIARFLKNYDLAANVSYTMGNYGEGDYTGKARASYTYSPDTLHPLVVSAMASLSSQTPDFFYQHFSSNHFKWENDFGKTQWLMLGAGATWRNVHLGTRWYSLSNYVYLNEEALPRQYAGNLNVLRFNLSPRIWLWKFCFDADLIYQKSSRSDVLRLPEFMANLSVFFNSKIFDEAATIQPGFDVYYNAAYYADAYMPALRSFYIQNEKETGNFFYLDLYLMLRVKRAVIFLKYQNLSELFGNYTYYSVPHYPLQDGALKLGISWKFYD
ncbi:MAG: putative porin [Bacteroidales bacterium]